VDHCRTSVVHQDSGDACDPHDDVESFLVDLTKHRNSVVIAALVSFVAGGRTT
jgi:hypothetical protein